MPRRMESRWQDLEQLLSNFKVDIGPGIQKYKKNKMQNRNKKKGEKGRITNKAEAEEDENWSRGRDNPGRECRVTEPTKERGRHH